MSVSEHFLSTKSCTIALEKKTESELDDGAARPGRWGQAARRAPRGKQVTRRPLQSLPKCPEAMVASLSVCSWCERKSIQAGGEYQVVATNRGEKADSSVTDGRRVALLTEMIPMLSLLCDLDDELQTEKLVRDLECLDIAAELGLKRLRRPSTSEREPALL